MTTTRDVLVRARRYVERGWTQGSYARSRSGKCVSILARSAVSFCAVGACMKAAKTSLIARQALQRAARTRNLVAWNDRKGRTQAEVIAAFDRAIAAQETP